MRNLLLSIALVAVPVAMFSAGYYILIPVTPTAALAVQTPSLGDLSGFAKIVTDVETIAGSGDLVKAQSRITDFETAWDQDATRLRAMNSTDWGNIDDAADAALKALRSKSPEAATVSATLADLQTALSDPAHAPAVTPKAVTLVSGIATTDANGRALPCETMLKDLTAKLATATPNAETLTQVTLLQAKALERCNADDDARADGFSAQALALISN